MKLSVLFFRCVRPQLQNWQLSDPHSEDSQPHPPSPLTLERNEEEENYNRHHDSHHESNHDSHSHCHHDSHNASPHHTYHPGHHQH